MRTRFVVAGALLGLLLLAAPAALAAATLSVGVTDITSTSVRVTWSRSGDWCFVSYDVQYREAGAAGWITAGTFDNRSFQNFTLTGLKPATDYEARVLDTDCGSAQGSNVVPFRTPAGSVIPGVSDGALFAGVGFVVLLALGLLVGRARRKRPK